MMHWGPGPRVANTDDTGGGGSGDDSILCWSLVALGVATLTVSPPALPKAAAVPMWLAAEARARAPVMHRSLSAPADTLSLIHI